MKIKLLSTIIAGVIIAGCGSDNNNDVSVPKTKTTSVQAYDGAVNGMVATHTCGDETNTTKMKTDGYGKVTVSSDTFAENPEQCSVILSVPEGGKAFDMSNGKDMSKVVYSIPEGLLVSGQKVAATPFTSLIAKTMASTDDSDVKTAMDAVFTQLGLDSSLTEEEKLGLLTDPDATLEKLDPAVMQDVVAKTMVLSDVLVAQKDNEDLLLEDIATVTTTIAADLVQKNPEFPTQTGSDKPIYVDLTDELADQKIFDEAAEGKVPADIAEETNPENIIVGEEQDPANPPVNPNPDEDGGTGGTGGTGAGDGSSGGTGN
ncbi:hypothetical protein [Photobacterium leiognathi]|uniref:Serine/threonine protein kinase n=1 Tax=Photobacterium leiognathi TaxID=553611 RepID=A0ABX5GDG3_PHOLE|nr:hypothetical protein [Photobacterium leiognathi]KJF91567.1 hypothetical protein UB42_01785 [Photobacterium leiognathi]PSV79956.1 hypothetical protein CTM94_14830 [Photobacterium leiognathi]